MSIQYRFKLLSMLFLLFCLVGCRGKLDVGLFKKKLFNTEEGASTSNYELAEYKLSIQEKSESELSVTLVNGNYETRKIDLGVKTERIETIAYKDNFWVYKAVDVKNTGNVEYKTFYTNFNDANPVAINFEEQTDIPCITNDLSNPWFLIANGYLYCASTSSSKLLRVSLSNYNDKVTFNSVTISEYFSQSLRYEGTTHYTVGNAFYIKVGTTTGQRILKIEGNAITVNLPSSNSGSGITWINNELVSINTNGGLSIYNNTPSVENIAFPGFDRALNYASFTTARILINKDVYNFACNSNQYSGALGLYKTNINTLRNPTTDFYSLGNIKCDENSKLTSFNLAGTLYFKAYDKVEKKVYLYRLNSTVIEKVIELADIEYSTALSSNWKLDETAFYSDETNLCFSGWNGSAYVPYCLDQNHVLNRMGQISSTDPFLAPVKFRRYGSDILFLGQTDKVRLYKMNLTTHVTSEVATVNNLLNLDYAWEHVYSYDGMESNTILTGQDSSLGIATFSDKNVEVTIQDQENNKYKHTVNRVNNGGVMNLHAYKNKVLFAYGQNHYFDLTIFERGLERKVNLKHRIIFTQGHFIAEGKYRYFYFININYELMRLDLETENVVVIDDFVTDFYAVEGRGFYRNDEPGKIYEVNEDLVKRIVSNNVADTNFNDLKNTLTIIGKNVFAKQIDSNTEDEFLVLAGDNGGKIIQDDQGNTLAGSDFWGFSGPNEKFSFFEGYDNYNNQSYLYLINNETGVAQSKYPLDYSNIYLFNLMADLNNVQKVIIEANASSIPNYIKLLEHNEGVFEEHTYNLPAFVDSDYSKLEATKITTTKDKVFLSLSQDGVDQVYLLKRSPALPELIFENKHDVIMNTVNNSLSDQLISTFYIFQEDNDKVSIHYSKLVNGYLGSAYAEYNPETNAFEDKKVTAKAGEHVLAQIIYPRMELLPDYLDYSWHAIENVTLNEHKKYSVFKYFKNSDVYYRVTEFMDYDKILLELEREIVPI